MATSNSPPSTVDKSPQRVQRMFGEIAGRYDLLNHVLSLGVDVYWRWRTTRRIPLRDESPLLDVCSGTGDLAFAFAKRHSSRVPIVGADFTAGMVAIARRKAHARRVGNTSFVVADTLRLPFAEDQFQVVSVAFGLRNVARTREGLLEMIRVCRPGGTVAVLEFSTPRSRLFGHIYRFYFRHVLPRIGQFVSGSRLDAYHYLPQSVGEFPSGQALADMMTECGLEDVEFTPLTFGIATLYLGTKGAS